MREEDWNEENESSIENFIMSPDETLLVIFFDQDQLKALPHFPDGLFIDLTYFIREPKHIFEVKTFHDNIVFGTVHENVEWSILNVIENVFAPVIFGITNWPDSILFKNYLIKLTCFLCNYFNFQK